MQYHHRSKHIIALIASTVSLLLAQTSHAYANAMTYAGGQLGGSSIDYKAKDEHFSSSSSGNGSGIAWHIFAGYQFNANFAVETGFIEYGDVSIDKIGGNKNASGSISQRSVDLLGKLIYPLISLFDVYIKGGVAYVANQKDLNAVAKAMGAHVSDAQGLAITYGVGSSYAFYPNARLDLTWQRIASDGGVKDSSFTGVGVTLYFS